jgi:gamma-aminobutyric acid receptor subunit alpha
MPQTYTMDCYFRQGKSLKIEFQQEKIFQLFYLLEWKDPRLAFKAPYKQIALSIKMLEQIWKPDTYFFNDKESYLHKIPTTNRLLRLSRDGSILYSSRLTVKATCPMNLRDFPMDKQVI